MNTITLDVLTKKLQTAPPNILERILGYAEALLDNQEKDNFILTNEQKNILIKQNQVAIEDCIEANLVYENLKIKYDL